VQHAGLIISALDRNNIMSGSVPTGSWFQVIRNRPASVPSGSLHLAPPAELFSCLRRSWSAIP
jgi:hypothetical protein